ncbi:MAG TPA: hypothetical protein DDY68_02415 [Porphyromonadaceae bacterium]|nr:hypothetical protein [Porphyromonadaceae bacterium]
MNSEFPFKVKRLWAGIWFYWWALWSGIRKARERGEYRSSYGLRKTVGKVANYYNLLFIVTIIDVMHIVALVVFDVKILPPFPALTC